MEPAKEDYKLPTWKSQDAKASFSRLVKESRLQDQLITNREEPVAIVVSKKRYDELMKKNGTLIDFFKKAPLPGVEIEIERNLDLPKEIDL